jgi:hypothetical protein
VPPAPGWTASGGSTRRDVTVLPASSSEPADREVVELRVGVSAELQTDLAAGGGPVGDGGTGAWLGSLPAVESVSPPISTFSTCREAP